MRRAAAPRAALQAPEAPVAGAQQVHGAGDLRRLCSDLAGAGWERLTTRAVALETGISVGTLYDYFPNKQALLSGYVRHSIDALLAAIEKQVVQASDAPWPERLHQLLRLTRSIDAPELPYYERQDARPGAPDCRAQTPPACA